MVVGEVPLLALPSGSILQFLLMTFPLLCVYIYFLWLAIERPDIANPNDERYGKDRIRLMDILYTYLATLILFCSLVVYMLWFVGKRRKLSKRYESEGIVILGNVEYNENYHLSNNNNNNKGLKNYCANFWSWMANGFTLRNNYGHLVYDLERVANHPACDYEDRKKRQLTGTIRKKVRVYYRYPREQVSVLVLPHFPYSGQPKIDMEADWASFMEDAGLDESDREVIESPSRNKKDVNAPEVLSRDRSIGVLLVSAFWILFLFFSSLYVTNQINVIEDYYVDEDGHTAWVVFWSFIGGGIPLISFGGNYLRWKIYERWVLYSGKKSRGKKSKRVRRGQHDSVDEEDDGEGSAYIQMT